VRQGLAALSDASTITIAVVAFFVFLVVVAVVRAVLTHDKPPYRRYRLGVFVERDDGKNDEDPKG